MRRKNSHEVVIRKIRKVYFAQNIYNRIDEYYDSKIVVLSEIANNFETLYKQNFPDWNRLLLACDIEGINLKKNEGTADSCINEKEILKKVRKSIAKFETKIKKENADRYQFSMIIDLKEVIQLLPWILTLGGFLNALVISDIFNTDIWLLFGIQDYLDLGIDAIRNFIPTLIVFTLIMASRYFIFINKIEYCIYQSDDDEEAFPKWFCLAEIIFGVILCSTLLVKAEYFLIGTIRIYLLVGLLSLFEGILNSFTKKTLKRLAYEAIIIFLIYTSVLTFITLNLKINIPNNETNYVISLNEAMPQGYRYITTTSKYHIFMEDEYTILIPIENTRKISFMSNP